MLKHLSRGSTGDGYKRENPFPTGERVPTDASTEKREREGFPETRQKRTVGGTDGRPDRMGSPRGRLGRDTSTQLFDRYNTNRRLRTVGPATK